MQFNDYYLSLFALFWFLFCWIGYSLFANKKAKTTVCLASVLQDYCLAWMQRMLKRENRVSDSNVIANLERNASFFSSSSLIIAAGILTVLGTMDEAMKVLVGIPFIERIPRGITELKIIFLSLIFIYAFFTFSWCMRQYNFAAILLGAAPILGEADVDTSARKHFAANSSKLLAMASNQFNYGLRAYYFGMASLSWFLSNYLFMFATIVVVAVLYFREFHSNILLALTYTKFENE
jgi:uncharacterized membrane protein